MSHIVNDPVYVRYQVQRGDKLSDLLQKSHMTFQEWASVNPNHKPKKLVRVGEEIVIKDPIASCMAEDGYYEQQQTNWEFSGGHSLDICGDAVEFSTFKPLQAFTKQLEKK